MVYSSFVVGEYHGGTAMGGKFISYCRPASFVTVLYERQFNLREKTIGKNRDKEMRCRFSSQLVIDGPQSEVALEIRPTALDS